MTRPNLPASALALVVLLSLNLPAIAIDEEHPAGRFDHLAKQRPGGVIGIAARPVSSLPESDALRLRWAPLAAGRWKVWLDDRSALPTLATGPGIDWAREAPLDLEWLATRAEDFLETHAAAPTGWHSQARLDPEGSGRRGADVWLVRFRQIVDGVPVEGAHFDFNVSHGKLVAFGARHWATVRLSTDPGLEAEEARRLLIGYLKPTIDDHLAQVGTTELLLVPVDADLASGKEWKGPRGAGISHRLIWRLRFTDGVGIASWTGDVDAHSGAIVSFHDATRYDRIKGHVNPASDTRWCDSGGCPEPNYPMPFADYTEDGGAVQFANPFGLYSCASPGATIETTLQGQYFRINDVCGPVSESTTCDAELDLGVADDINCGASAGASPGNTDASRSAYYSLNLVHRKALFWISGNPWLESQVECKTNVASTCNATWGNNTINMFRAGDGCGNTGQIQGIVTHEWGHGFDENDGGDFDNPSEAYADVVAIFESRESCVGPGFREAQTCTGYGDSCLSCTGVRDMDWDARQDHTPATPSGFVASYCPSGDGPCGEETHCASYVPSEAMFDLATRDLPAMGIDPDTSWQLAERLWYQSRPGSGGDVFHCSLPASDSCGVGSWYQQLRLQDDDDGDLANGTPHAAALFAAFDRHDIACGASGDPENQNSSSCPTLEAPQLSFAAQTQAVELDWEPVPGAAAYRIYRNENGCDRGQYPIAEVLGATTSHLDAGLADGFPLFYRVQAIGADAACESPVSPCIEAAAQPLAGRLVFSRTSYGCDHELVLEVTDANHPTASMSVSVWSDTDAGPETVLLTETSVGSARFSGSIFATPAAPAVDGLLSIADGDTIHAEYVDQDDGLGGVDIVRSAVASADCSAPAIAQVRESDVTDLRATIRWSTDEPATSWVFFGETIPPVRTAAVPGLTTDHAVDLSGLTECTVYHYAVRSTDAAGNVADDDRNGVYFHFESWGDLGAGLQPCHQGRVAIESVRVGCGAAVPITTADRDLNRDPAVAETVTVPLTSTTEPIAESAVLTETGPDTSIFVGSIPTAEGPPMTADGVLQIRDGDLLTATYLDEDDGSGSVRVSFDSAVVDCTGPELASIRVADVTANTAAIEWTTSDSSVGRVDWGTTSALGNSVTDDNPSTSHSVTIGTFAECSRVYFRVVATDARGYSSTADAGGLPFEFDGGTIGGALFRDGFETDTGWTLEGEWETGTPLGLGTAPGDPLQAVAGSAVLGHDLSGLGDHPGDFEPLSAEAATSPAIDVGGVTSAELRLYRWLNIATGGFAYVEIKDAAGSWTPVWISPTSGGFTQSEWTQESYDVSAYLAGNSDFRVRIRNRSHITSAIDAGWNVDELIVRDTGVPLYGSCGGCAGTPTFAGVVSAQDDDPCADSGVTLTWAAAPAWGSGNAGTYAVYRDTQPGFSPQAANRVAMGVSGTSWTDPTAPAGVTLFYLVRAENDESCAGGPNNGGTVEENLVVREVVNETGQPGSGAVGATLLVDAVNRAHVRLTWTASPTAATHHIERSSSPDGLFARVAESAEPLWEDFAAMGDSLDWFYLVKAADACGNEETAP